MKLTSHGAAGEVTGSCHLLEVGERRILLDCGLIQGRDEDEARNRDPFPFDPASLDAVVLSHAHIDHSGRLPILLRQGFTGPIYTHVASDELCRILLRDSAYLHQRDVQYENRRRKRRGLPLIEALYNEDDVFETLEHLRPMDYDSEFEVTPGIRATLHDAGHIIGSAIVSLALTEGDQRRTLVFSGDLGHRDAPILKDFTRLKKADFVLMESTYGNRLHRDWSATFEEVSGIVDALRGQRGNVLIPAFAVGRSQMILYMLARYYKTWDIGRWHVFLDSPMAIEATEVYARHTALYDEAAATFYHQHGAALDMPNLHFSRTAEESMAINRIESGAIVIAGSGMMNGGRIRHHLKHNLWREDAHVVIVGYQAPGTLGRRLVDGADEVRLWEHTVRVRAKIHTIGGLSAHADQQGMVQWYSAFENAPPVLLVHGEPEAAEALATRLHKDCGAQARLAQAGKSTDLLALERF